MPYMNLLYICIFCICPLFSAYSQIGINTTNPSEALEVAGDMKISDEILIKIIPHLNDSDTSTFLIQDENDLIKTLDVSNPVGAALGYIQEYVIVNPNLDWVLDFDSRVDATQYVLNTISANFNRELKMNTTGGINSSIPYTSAYIKNGTWHIIADYPSANNKNEAEVGTWTITTLIYSKDLSKQFGTVNIPMNNTTTGAASSPIIN